MYRAVFAWSKSYYSKVDSNFATKVYIYDGQKKKKKVYIYGYEVGLVHNMCTL